MAKYDRKFLVPYLENLCALHLAQEQIQDKYNRDKRENRNIELQSEALEAPDGPYLEDTGLQVMGIVVGAILVVISWLDILIISFLAGLAGWFMLIVGTIWYISTKRKNDEAEADYAHEYALYAQQRKELDKALEHSELALFASASIYTDRNKSIIEVLDKMYAVNIIPRRYRDKYAIAYLYDWFSTGGSDDLDMALNTYVLEEIKERLDIIIDKLSQSLLNQRIMIAQQYQTMEMQQQYHQEMMDKLSQIQTTEEEHSRYLGMIEANTTALTYFAAADYLRKSFRTRK